MDSFVFRLSWDHVAAGSVFQVACVLYIINILYDGLSSALAPCLDYGGAVLHLWNGCP